MLGIREQADLVVPVGLRAVNHFFHAGSIQAFGIADPLPSATAVADERIENDSVFVIKHAQDKTCRPKTAHADYHRRFQKFACFQVLASVKHSVMLPAGCAGEMQVCQFYGAQQGGKFTSLVRCRPQPLHFRPPHGRGQGSAAEVDAF